MSKRTETTVYEEFDKDGNVTVRETTTIVEEDSTPVKPYPYPWTGPVISGGTTTPPYSVNFNIDGVTSSIQDVAKRFKKDFGLS